MKRLFNSIIKLFIVLAVVYCTFFSFFMLKDNEIGLVYESSSNRAVYYFADDYNFVWHGLQPWLYKIEKISTNKSLNFTSSVVLPGVLPLKNNIYFIKVPVLLNYSLNKDDLPDLVNLSKSNSSVNFIQQIVDSSCNAVLSRYIGKSYIRLNLMKNHDEISKEIVSKIEQNVKKTPYVLKNVSIGGSILFPEMNIYREGLKYSSDLRKMILINKKKSLSLKNELEKENSINAAYYKKLSKMSLIIKDNPDILKYIYIDKMAPNIKVIITSDKTGLPSLFDSDKEKNAEKNGDIDNLK